MHDLPPLTPSPASARNRRSGRTSGAAAAQCHRRSGRRTKKPAARKTGKRLNLTLWQAVVLLGMAAGLTALILSYNRAESSMRQLAEQRQKAFEEYQAEVRSHQVKYQDYITYYAAAYRLDPAYVAAIIKRESDYDPRAVSRKDARGLMQMMPDTFDWVRKNTGYRGADISVLFEPEAAIKMGCYLLRYIIDTMKTDDPILVTCAYHAGWGNVNAWLQRYSTDGKHLKLSQIPMDDTRYYAGKVLNAYAIYQQYYY